MKVITRDVKVYTYTFAMVDVATGNATEMKKVITAEPLTRSGMKEFIEKNPGFICIHKDEKNVKYSLPLTNFVAACEAYANSIKTYADTDSVHHDIPDNN